MTKLSSLLLIATFMSCSTTNQSSSPLQGSWKMTEYLADIGDGNGTWQPADAANQSVLEFRADGTLGESGPATANSGSKYEILNDSTVVFVRGENRINVKYKIIGNTLTLNPPCIEACGQKFIRMEK